MDLHIWLFLIFKPKSQSDLLEGDLYWCLLFAMQKLTLKPCSSAPAVAGHCDAV